MAIDNDYEQQPRSFYPSLPPTVASAPTSRVQPYVRNYPIFSGPRSVPEAEGVAASYPAPRAPNTSYASGDDNAREMRGMQSGARGGNYAPAGSEAKTQAAANTYGDTDTSFGFRSRLAARGTPGEQLTMQYGPGVGGARVTATADQNGRFNQFSGVGNSGAPAPGPLDAQMNALMQRAAYYRGQGTLTGRIFAANAMKQLAQLRNQQVALGTLGVHQGHLAVEQAGQHLREQIANPEIQYKTAQNALIQEGNLNAVQRIAAARGGDPNMTSIPTMQGVYRVPSTAGGFYPGFPTMPGQSPVPPPAPTPWHDMSLKNYDGY